MTVRVEHCDMLEAIPRLVAEGVVVDAVVTDPPYHLTSLPSRSEVPGKWGRRTEEQKAARRLSGGFMGQQWDGGDIAFRPETWATVASIMRPGAFLVAFGGTRTHHRVWCAIEDAGFVIQDTIMWLFGSGFPKRRDMLKPAFEPIIRARKMFNASPNWDIIAEFTARLEALLWVINARTADKTVGGTDNSARWLVHALHQWSRDQSGTMDTSRLQGEVSTSLSIALLWNAILTALSTRESTFTTEMESSLTTGLRTLNSWLSEITPASITRAVSHQDGLWPNASTAGENSSGTLPNWSGIPTVFAAAPVLSSTAISILGTLADIAAASLLLRPATAASFARCCVPTDLTIEQNEPGKSAPALNAAPFLKLSPAAIQSIAAESAWQPPTGLSPDCQPICLAYKPGGKRMMQVDECRVGVEPSPSAAYRAKGKVPSTIAPGTYTSTVIQNRMLPENWLKERPGEQNGRWPANICLEDCDEVLGAFPESNASKGEFRRVASKGYESTVQIAGRNQDIAGVGFGDSGSAARFFFNSKAGVEDRWGSRHPTVKPVDLIAWLVALVTPPGGTFLDPFAGSGTAAVAALKTGRNAILIEREAEYIADIRERIAFYEGGGQHSAQAKHRNRKSDDGPLFAPAYNPEADAIGSYNDAVRAVGERVKAGEPLPEFFLSGKK